MVREERKSPIVIPGLTRDRWPRAQGQRRTFPAARWNDEETETLHPQIRPFGHRVTLSAAFSARERRTANVQHIPGKTPGRCAPLDGYGLGVKPECRGLTAPLNSLFP